MTLFDDICEVHDGVLKAPPLRAYGHANTVCNSTELAKSKTAAVDEHDHTDVYKKAKILAVEAVRIMQLASKNIEKEQRKIKQEAKKESDYVFEVGLVLGTVRQKR